jgi:hypothetical protein
MTKIKEMLVFGNTQVAAFDESGNQVPELQIKWLLDIWAERATSLGHDVVGCKCNKLMGEYRIQEFNGELKAFPILNESERTK